jgi:hypothetical protein
MDAASFAALAAVLGVELPAALADAMLEIERSRMQAADNEARSLRVFEDEQECRVQLLIAMGRSWSIMGRVDLDHVCRWTRACTEEARRILHDALTENEIYPPGESDAMDEGE